MACGVPSRRTLTCAAPARCTCRLIFYAAYALQIVSVACELMHLNYAKDGKGLRFRESLRWTLSRGTQTLSELILSVMLIALAFGWTLGLESQEPLEGLAGRILGGLQASGAAAGYPFAVALLLMSVGVAQVFSASFRKQASFNNRL